MSVVSEEKQIWISSRMAAILLMGFASGLPFALTTSTLQAWMKTENVDLTVIGIFALVQLPYALKFIWSPLMDRFIPPFLGRRRGWMLITQLALIFFIGQMALFSPKQFPFMVAFLAVLVAFFSASQDVVIDAYRTDLLTPKERGPGAAVTTLGWRMGYLFSGALALVLADHFSWRWVYLLMAGAMGVGVVTSFMSAEPEIPSQTPKTMRDAIVLPFKQFFGRKAAIEVLLFIVLYKLDMVMATALTTPFMMELDFTKTQIAAVTKTFGILATIAGTFFGGGLMVRWSLKKALWIFGLAQGISNLAFMYLAHVGHNYGAMVASIAIENFCTGLGLSAYFAFMMSICDKRFTATQYALLTSLMAFTRIFGAAPTGYFVKWFGWENFFLICTLSMIPGLLLLLRYDRWSEHLHV